MWSRVKVVEQILEEKLILLAGFDEEVTKICSVDHIEEEIEVAVEIRLRIQQTKGEIAIARARVKNVGTSSSSHGSTQNHHTEEHTATNNPNQAPMPLQDNQHASSENSGQIHQGQSGSSPSTAFQTNFTTSQDSGPSSPSSVNELPPIPPPQSSHSQSTTKPRLPKLVLPKFNGEITKFKSFWDSFDSAVNKNADLSSVDKFNYLHALLEGQAARAIQGLTLSESNYQAAVEILHERFGKTQQIISAHMDELLKLPTCTWDKPGQLRIIYDKIKINGRGLEPLGVKAEQYGSFLIPVIMSRLPAEVRLHVARVSTKDVWEINELLKVIQAEVEAREMSDTMKIQEREGTETTFTPKRGFSPGTANSLFARSDDGSGIRCAFCNGEHYSETKFRKKIQTRKNILIMDKRCFWCLSVGHRANQCPRKKKCRVCDRTDHHQSVCEMSSNQSRSETPAAPTNAKTKEDREPSASKKPPQNITTTSTARSKVQVLLQTAKTCAYVENGTALLPVRVLLDSGSQRSYITNHLKRKLGMIPIKTETLNLNTFGNDKFSKKDCDLIKLRLQGKHGEDVNISALSFEAICSPVPAKV